MPTRLARELSDAWVEEIEDRTRRLKDDRDNWKRIAVGRNDPCKSCRHRIDAEAREQDVLDDDRV